MVLVFYFLFFLLNKERRISLWSEKVFSGKCVYLYVVNRTSCLIYKKNCTLMILLTLLRQIIYKLSGFLWSDLMITVWTFFRRNISGQEFGGMYCVVLIVRYIALSLSHGMGLNGVLVLFSLDYFIALWIYTWCICTGLLLYQLVFLGYLVGRLPSSL